MVLKEYRVQSPFYKWGKKGSEKECDMTKVFLLDSDRAGD